MRLHAERLVMGFFLLLALLALTAALWWLHGVAYRALGEVGLLVPVAAVGASYGLGTLAAKVIGE